MTQRPDQHPRINLVTVWGDVVTTLPVTSFWILRNGRSLGGINYTVGTSSNGYMTYHGGGNIVCDVMQYNSVSAPRVVFCKEIGERVFSVISTYLCQLGYDCGVFDATIGERVFAVISTYLCQLGYDCGVFAATTCPILTHVTCDDIETFDGNETSESQTTLELGEHVLADSIKRPSCASLMIGEALFTDRLHHAYLWGDTYKLFDSFDLTLTGTKWIQSRHTSEAYFLSSVRLGNGANSPAVGIGIRTINIKDRYTLWINGEPIIYILRDRITSEFWDLVSCELCSVRYVERRKQLDIQVPDASLQFMRCHQINVGCFLKPNIITCRRNDSIGLIFRSVGNVMQDIIYIISVQVRFPVKHDQLQVQVTTANRLQVQVTYDISFANNHITSSFASCDDLLNALSWIASWGEKVLVEKMMIAKEETASPVDFMPRIDMRSYDCVSRNDGGDTMLRDYSRLSGLVAGVDMTCLMGNDEIISDDDDGMIPIVAVSNTNGGPYLVDVTDIFNNKCITLLIGPRELVSLDVMGQYYWRENTSRADGKMTMIRDHTSSTIRSIDRRMTIGRDYTNSTIRSPDIDTVWSIESNGMQLTFGLESRETMGRLALQKTETNGDTKYVRRLDLVEELEERCEQIQDGTKSTVTVATDNNNFENLNLTDRGNGEIDLDRQETKNLECENLRTTAGERDTLINIVLDGYIHKLRLNRLRNLPRDYGNLRTESPDGDDAIDDEGLHCVSDNSHNDIRICMETLVFDEEFRGQLQSELKIGHIKSKLTGIGGTNFVKLVERDIHNLIGSRSIERYAHGGIVDFNKDATTAYLTVISERYDNPTQMYNSATRLLLLGIMHRGFVGSTRNDPRSDTVVRAPGRRYLRNIVMFNCDEFDRHYNPCSEFDRHYNPCSVVLRKRTIADSGFIHGRMGVSSHQFTNFFYDDADKVNTDSAGNGEDSGERNVHFAEGASGFESDTDTSYDGDWSYEPDSDEEYLAATTNTWFLHVHEALYGDTDVTPRSYQVTKSTINAISGMIDRGANGGVAGDPKFLRTISITDETIDIIGIDNHAISRRPIGTVGGVARVVGSDGQMKEVIAIFHNYAILGRGKCIHSALQLEAFSNKADDRAIQYGGTQTIKTQTIGHDESAETGNKCFIGLERRINCPLQLIDLGQSVCMKTTLIGEQFLERIEKAVNVNFIQGAVATVGDYLMFGVYGNHKQQLVKRRHNICADDSVCAYMQQVLGSAYCSSCYRLFNMSRLFVNLYASIAYINTSSSLSDVTNTPETELRTCVIRRDILPDGNASTPTDTSFTMDHTIASYCLGSKSNAYSNTPRTHNLICGLGYSHDDVLDESWCYSYASFGFFVGSLLLLRRVMGSHTLQTADFKMRHGHEPIKYRHRTDMPDITDFTFPKQDWNDIPLKANARNNPQLASKRDSIQSTNSTNRRGVTNWVRVQVDTDSIRTINASTFGEIGTYSSHIWTMLWS